MDKFIDKLEKCFYAAATINVAIVWIAMYSDLSLGDWMMGMPIAMIAGALLSIVLFPITIAEALVIWLVLWLLARFLKASQPVISQPSLPL